MNNFLMVLAHAIDHQILMHKNLGELMLCSSFTYQVSVPRVISLIPRLSVLGKLLCQCNILHITLYFWAI